MYPIFNIRVYGLLINENNEVLATDEFRFRKEMTKFPGGGLQFGEGTIDCIKREFREELGCEIDVLKHFYTTDYFQQSAFHEDHQLISIYYLVKGAPSLPRFVLRRASKKDSAKALREGEKGEEDGKLVPEKYAANLPFRDKRASQSFRWISLSTIRENNFTFPIDKKVAKMLKDYSKSG